VCPARPPGNEPDSFLLVPPHSPWGSEALGDVWELVPKERVIVRLTYPVGSWGGELVLPEKARPMGHFAVAELARARSRKRWLIVSDVASEWLTKHAREWVRFSQVLGGVPDRKEYYARDSGGNVLDEPNSAVMTELISSVYVRGVSPIAKVSLAHRCGWSLSVYPSGRITWENLDDQTVGRSEMHNVSQTKAFELWCALARGDFGKVREAPWRPTQSPFYPPRAKE